MQLTGIKKGTDLGFNLEKMSDSAVLPSISPGSVGSNPTNPLHINFPSMTSQNGQASVTLAPNSLSSLGIKPISNSSINTSLNSSHSGVSGSGTPEPTSGSNGGSVKSETGSNGGPSPIPASVSNAISLIQAQQNAQNGALSGPPAVMGTNQTDYFRNCNVPNLINKWRRRHTWLFLKEGKMFCQVKILKIQKFETSFYETNNDKLVHSIYISIVYTV